MAYSALKNAIAQVIRQNGNKEITGNKLQAQLFAMIDSLGAGYLFMGIAPASISGTPDQKVFYIGGAGTYTISNQSVSINTMQLIVVLYDTEWHFEIIGFEIANDSVTTGKILDGAVTNPKLATNAVTENKIQNGAVTTNKIGSSAVTRPKLGDDVKDELDKKANIDGFYSTLGAGVAENLVGRGSVPAEYTFRTSGGSADLGSGTAQIKKLMGRTLAFNQGIPNGNFATNDYWSERYGTLTIANNKAALVSSSNNDGAIIIDIYYKIGHKYLIAFNAKASVSATLNVGCDILNSAGANYQLFTNASLSTITQRFAQIFTSATDGGVDGMGLGFRLLANANESFELSNVILIDLTLMFGAGNEPSTPAEFEALFPLPYYAYNAGKLISVTATGIKTNGFNQWDEETELGGLDMATGEKVASSVNLRSKNYIGVFPDTDYYLLTPIIAVICYYDINKNFISSSGGFYGSGIKHTPNNCYYILFSLYDDYGTTYKHDVCLNLSWSGYRNGEYEPYWESELPIPITTMTGKLNGAGESVVIFPDGACGAGTAYDYGTPDADGVIREVTRVIVKVDLGNLDWDFYPLVSGGTKEGRMYARGITNIKFANVNSLANILCPKYITDTAQNTYNHSKDKAISLDGITILVYDSDYTSSDQIAAFKAAMSGVYLYYELDTPEKYTLDTPLALNYRVDDFGTEMELPQNDDEPVTAPIRYDVQYAMNAVDTLRRLPENYISKESFADFLAEFDSKLGAALNASVTTTMAFNSDTQKYGFTITITPNA